MKNPLVRGCVIMSILSITCRFFLCHHSSRLGWVAQRLSSLQIKSGSIFNRQNYLLIESCIAYITANIALSIWYVVDKDETLQIQMYTFGNRIDHPTLHKAFSITLQIFYVIFFASPVNAFLTFFILVCHDIEELLHSYKETMIIQRVPDYERLMKTYLSLRKYVFEIDKQLNCTVFWAILTNIFVLYFGITAIIGEGATHIALRISTFFSLGYSTFMFIIPCLYANRVSSSAAAIAEEANTLEENPMNYYVIHNRYLHIVNQDMYMTIGGFLPLKKNFILVSIGTMVTYSVLIKDIMRGD
ncbi:hypothetical protein HNY73_003698 [Argiope bruennichi]|uniref:Gustatory receptor n=1 Tax=Argiope bruennichi TaxID=94029 RepID=A0A8T0FQX3_ARGBR|nr:hypothetical protein HNY73_003698 [Argiope bruennichi]